MSHHEVRSLRVLPAGSPTVAIEARRFDPRPLVGFLGAIVLMCAAFAVFADGTAFRLLMGSIGVLLAIAAVVFVTFQFSIASRRVRYDTRPGALRFVPRAHVHLGFLVMALAGVAPAALGLLVGFPQAAVTDRVTLFVGLASVVWLVQQAWSLRLPVGLTLSERGLRGVRGAKAADLDWDRLASVHVGSTTTGAKLQLRLQTGGAIQIEPRYTGSDANVVAPVIRYFLDHPDQRATLADPRAALALVESAAG